MTLGKTLLLNISDCAEQHILDLPGHLRDLILKKLELNGGLKAVVKLRLVSKACRDAVAQYAGRASCRPRAHEPFRICQVLPGMRELLAVHKGGRLDARPLSKCSQLTRLVFARVTERQRYPPERYPAWPSFQFYLVNSPCQGEQIMTFDAASGFLRPIYQADLDISHLPSNLMVLELDNIMTYPADYNAIHFTGLTELAYFSDSLEDSLLCNLVDCLPHLQVRHNDTPRHFWILLL